VRAYVDYRKGANSMENSKLERINELARLAKTVGLTDEQTAERAALRAEYIAEFRAATAATLDNTYIERPDGTREQIKKRKEN
jgi:Uncharacterized protein conserved in bacteria